MALTGKINSKQNLQGSVAQGGQLGGTLAEANGLVGTVSGVNVLTGKFGSAHTLEGLMQNDGDIQGHLEQRGELIGVFAGGGGVTQEIDPVFMASPASGITSEDISEWDSKQDALVSGTNIKTINNQPILGEGNLNISGAPKNIWYGICGTATGERDKVVITSDGHFTLTKGNMVRVKFTNAQKYHGTARLNVDGTGAVDIARVGATTSTQYYWSVGEVVDFVYDGDNFVMSNKGTASTTYYGLTKLSSAIDSTSTALAATPSAVKQAYDLADSKVSDVQVDGTSVVTGGVAEVDLTGKVDKVTGKGLSSNDFTTALLDKLNGIAAGAEANVQSNWNETDTTSDAFILNKPTIPEESVYFGEWDDIDYYDLLDAIQSGKVVIILHPSATVDEYFVCNNYRLVPNVSSPDIYLYGIGVTQGSIVRRGYYFEPAEWEYSDIGIAELNSPTFTGTPQAPTATAGTNNTQIATTAFVANATASKQDTLVSGTNIKTINESSLLGSGNISIQGASGTPIPTADEVAEFDSSAHMNSTDMTAQEIQDFVDGNLNGQEAITRNDLRGVLDDVLPTRTLLWTNPNPSAVFTAQTMSLSGAYYVYDFLEIEYLATQSQDVVTGTKKIERFPCKSSSVVSMVMYTTGWVLLHRATWWETNGFHFDHAYYNSLLTPSSNGQGNDNLIPYKIYGIKL